MIQPSRYDLRQLYGKNWGIPDFRKMRDVLSGETVNLGSLEQDSHDAGRLLQDFFQQHKGETSILFNGQTYGDAYSFTDAVEDLAPSTADIETPTKALEFVGKSAVGLIPEGLQNTGGSSNNAMENTTKKMGVGVAALAAAGLVAYKVIS